MRKSRLGQADSSRALPPPGSANEGKAQTHPARRGAFRRPRLVQRRVLFVLALAVVMLGMLAWELRNSTLQAYFLSRYVKRLTWTLEDGAATDALRAPRGPYDLRHGYAQLPEFQRALVERGFRVTQQAQPTAELLKFSSRGFLPPYDEKSAVGLRIQDARGLDLYRAPAARFHYRDFEAVPPLAVRALLHVENRTLLDAARPRLNPALEWDRLVYAGLQYVLQRTAGKGHRVGGSTLATQIQKFRHSPYGRTQDIHDKLAQMASASLLAYRDGPENHAARREIVLDYINNMPLGAYPGFGEVSGLGQGLWVWFGKTPQQVAQDLRLEESGAQLARKAQTFKQTLALLLATRRPALYLGADPQPLQQRLDLYLTEFRREGLISPELERAAHQAALGLRLHGYVTSEVSFAERKATNVVRSQLCDLLDLGGWYELDRLDLRVETTLVSEVQRAVVATLRQLRSQDYLEQNGFFGRRLLTGKEVEDVNYTFLLYEADPAGNRLIVQADNLDQPLDLNVGAKLELGSTAKLRAMADYLMLVSALHDEFSGLQAEELQQLEERALDTLTNWSVRYVRENPGTSREAMLQASLQRGFPVAPDTLYTGGWHHPFANYDNRFDHDPDMRLQDAFCRSVNVPIVHMMREIVEYHVAGLGYDKLAILQQVNHPDRAALLEAAADRESRKLLWSFYKKYGDLEHEQALRKLCGEGWRGLRRFALYHLGELPQATPEELLAAASRIYGDQTDALESSLQEYHRAFSAGAMDLHRLASWMGRPVLELWVVRERGRDPQAGWLDLVERSATLRQEAMAWVHHPRQRQRQNRWLQDQMEYLAFRQIHRDWQRLGYPFDSLVPSLGTALGSSADRPQALAVLAGIIQNDGLLVPERQLESLHFAEDTPYEIHFAREPGAVERVMPVEVARTLKQLLLEIVEAGTGRRARNALKDANGQPIPVGGKTGSGDNNFQSYEADGTLLASRPVNRTASFVFLIGDRHFGVVTAHVDGPQSGRCRFTSALALQTFKSLAPALAPLVGGEMQRASVLQPAQQDAQAPPSSRLAVQLPEQENRAVTSSDRTAPDPRLHPTAFRSLAGLNPPSSFLTTTSSRHPK